MTKKQSKRNSIIRKDQLSKGQFTTVSYDILRNNKLSSNDKIVLIELLSNDNSFILNHTILIKRTGIKEKGIRNCLRNLEEQKYLKRFNKARGSFYIVCGLGKVDDIKYEIVDGEINALEGRLEVNELSVPETEENATESIKTTFTNKYGTVINIDDDLVQRYNDILIINDNFINRLKPFRDAVKINNIIRKQLEKI